MEFLGFSLSSNLFLAPMAGVTDRPFRKLCRRLGAGLAVSEMVAANSLLYGSAKTVRRATHVGEAGPISVQIVGSDPSMLADCARHNVDGGADIIDINMGCPAKKICKVDAGSALMRDETLVGRILNAVCAAVPKNPVTLKIRTGWDEQHRNAVRIAQIAQDCGIRALAVHGRTRAAQFRGQAEYETIAEVKSRVAIPVIANGDIVDAKTAHHVFSVTGADAIMIGRAAQGRPWLFREILQDLRGELQSAPPSLLEIHTEMRAHLIELYDFYGEATGVLVARKHIGWYSKGVVGGARFRAEINRATDAHLQLELIDSFFGLQSELSLTHTLEELTA